MEAQDRLLPEVKRLYKSSLTTYREFGKWKFLESHLLISPSDFLEKHFLLLCFNCTQTLATDLSLNLSSAFTFFPTFVFPSVKEDGTHIHKVIGCYKPVSVNLPSLPSSLPLFPSPQPLPFFLTHGAGQLGLTSECPKPRPQTT